MNFIDKFLDLTAPLPRKLVRLLKLLKTVEELSKELKINLQKSREKHLQKLKENNLKNLESSSLKTIEKMHKELLNLSDYKKEIIKELKYIVENSFIEKLTPIIDEGQKECDNNLNGIYGNSFPNPDKLTTDDYRSISEYSNFKKKDDIDSISITGTNSLLRNKKNRAKSIKNKKNNLGNPQDYSDEITQSLQNDEKQKIYCSCKKSSYGEMIECENPKCPHQWFHYSCVGITKGKEPPEWYCSKKCEEEAKNSKKGKNKKKKTS